MREGGSYHACLFLGTCGQWVQVQDNVVKLHVTSIVMLGRPKMLRCHDLFAGGVLTFPKHAITCNFDHSLSPYVHLPEKGVNTPLS